MFTVTMINSSLLDGTFVFDDTGTPVLAPLVYHGDEKSQVVKRHEGNAERNVHAQRHYGEVYTPAWLCNLQIGLHDDNWAGVDNLFNTARIGDWETEQDVYAKLPEDRWLEYLKFPVLEACCGEGAYLAFRYDKVTGEPIPLRDRAGVLDRKLLIAFHYARAHQVLPEQTYNLFADALDRVHGYEYQARPLLIARENMVLTVIDFLRSAGITATQEQVDDLCRRAVRQLPQMDGLTQCIPGSCSSHCRACKKSAYTGHDGSKVAIWMDGDAYSFDELFS